MGLGDTDEEHCHRGCSPVYRTVEWLIAMEETVTSDQVNAARAALSGTTIPWYLTVSVNEETWALEGRTAGATKGSMVRRGLAVKENGIYRLTELGKRVRQCVIKKRLEGEPAPEPERLRAIGRRFVTQDFLPVETERDSSDQRG